MKASNYGISRMKISINIDDMLKAMEKVLKSELYL